MVFVSSDPIVRAVISDDQRYRYWLCRPFAEGQGWVVFIMLNPSTADSEVDDPTIRRCVSFSRQWGCRGIIVVNLFAMRSPDPDVLIASLKRGEDIVGPDNFRYLEKAVGVAETTPNSKIVCAWGSAKPARVHSEVIESMISRIKALTVIPLMCLGETKDGHPRHPLYVPGDQPLVPFQ